MAFGKGNALGSNNSNASSTSVVITTTATAEVGNMIVVASAWDNTDTSDTALSQRLKVTDSAGNIYTILGSVVNAQAAAAAGAHIILAAAMVTTQLASGGTITVTSDTSRTAKCAAAEEFTLATTQFMLADKNLALDDAADPSALSLPSAFTTLPSREYLEIYALAAEGPNTDAYTWDADQTTLTSDGSAGSMHLRWSYRIFTGTSDTVDVTSDTADRDSVSLLVALAQYEPDPFPTTGILDNFNRANENPLSGGGNWETAGTAGSNPMKLTSNAADTGTAGVTQMSTWAAATFTDDQEVGFTHSNANNSVTGQGPIVLINVAGSGGATWDGYQLRRRSSVTGTVHDQLHVRRFINNANTRDCLQWIGLGNLTTGDKYGLRRVGDILETWYQPNGGSWTFLGAMEAVGDLIGGQIGIGSIGGTSVHDDRLDDFFGGAPYIRPASITATSDVTGAVAHAKVLAVDAISATSAMSATVTLAAKPVIPAAISASSNMSATVTLLRIVPDAITATSAVTATVLGGKLVVPAAISASSAVSAAVSRLGYIVPAAIHATSQISAAFFHLDRIGSRTGNGGELFTLQLAPNGTAEVATLAASISDTDTVLTLTGYGGLPASGGFCVTIDDEVMLVTPAGTGTGSYRIRERGTSNTTPDSHTAGADVTWDDSYDMAQSTAAAINAHFIANINETGEVDYPGWLVCFDSTQAYLGGARYPMHVTELVGVFDPGVGVTGTSKTDAPQPSAISSVAATSEDCPAALTIPARISIDIVPGDVGVMRYTNPEASIMTLGPRSATLQSWFGMKRVDDDDVEVTYTDVNGNIVDGTVVGQWHNPLGPGIEPATGAPTATDVPYTSVTLDGDERTFTHGGTPSPPNFEEKGWPMCALAVRQGTRRVPYWASWDWHDFGYVYAGFVSDATYVQILVNRNGIFYDSVPEVELPGPQDIDGPDAVWDDGSYYFGAAWYVAIYDTPYLVIGPTFVPAGPPPNPILPVVSFPGGIPDFEPLPVIDPVEGGSGGGISPPRGARFYAQVI